jgi:hypothetical protein
MASSLSAAGTSIRIGLNGFSVFALLGSAPIATAVPNSKTLVVSGEMQFCPVFPKGSDWRLCREIGYGHDVHKLIIQSDGIRKLALLFL